MATTVASPTGNESREGLGRRFTALPARYLYGGALLVLILLQLVLLGVSGTETEFPRDFVGASAAIGDPCTTKETPSNLGRAVSVCLDTAIFWTAREGGPVFRFVKTNVQRALLWLEDFLLWLRWPVAIGAVALLALALSGRRLAMFSAGSLFVLGVIGLWASTMETLALITVAVTLSIVIAVPIGIIVSRSDRLDGLVRPVLDAMQTMPSFVYLVPVMLFLGVGNVAAVFATIVYAVAPAVRLTNLGIRQVSPGVVEAARSFGTTSQQLLWKVQIPMAVPTIMAGINQTTMMALAMVVIAGLVGAGGLGNDVNQALGRLEPGKAILGGVGIVVLAITTDRLTQAAARKRQEALTGGR